MAAPAPKRPRITDLGKRATSLLQMAEMLKDRAEGGTERHSLGKLNAKLLSTVQHEFKLPASSGGDIDVIIADPVKVIEQFTRQTETFGKTVQRTLEKHPCDLNKKWRAGGHNELTQVAPSSCTRGRGFIFVLARAQASSRKQVNADLSALWFCPDRIIV